jgi:hypothetical protein
MPVGAEAQNREATNNVVSLTQAKTTLPAGRGEAKCDEVLIHVRFHPNAEVNTIDQCPEHLHRQDWFFPCAMGPPELPNVCGRPRFFLLATQLLRSHFEPELFEPERGVSMPQGRLVVMADRRIF